MLESSVLKKEGSESNNVNDSESETNNKNTDQNYQQYVFIFFPEKSTTCLHVNRSQIVASMDMQILLFPSFDDKNST